MDGFRDRPGASGNAPENSTGFQEGGTLPADPEFSAPGDPGSHQENHPLVEHNFTMNSTFAASSLVAICFYAGYFGASVGKKQEESGHAVSTAQIVCTSNSISFRDADGHERASILFIADPQRSIQLNLNSRERRGMIHVGRGGAEMLLTGRDQQVRAGFGVLSTDSDFKKGADYAKLFIVGSGAGMIATAEGERGTELVIRNTHFYRDDEDKSQMRVEASTTLSIEKGKAPIIRLEQDDTSKVIRIE